MDTNYFFGIFLYFQCFVFLRKIKNNTKNRLICEPIKGKNCPFLEPILVFRGWTSVKF